MSITAKPPAIVLGLEVTGLAVVRALAEYGIEVHAVSRWTEDVGRPSRRCRLIDLQGKVKGPRALADWLVDYAGSLDERPVVFTGSDQLALMLAEHHERLLDVCRLWNNDIDKLSMIVRKSSLYEVASAAGIQVPPGLNAPRTSEVRHWCERNPGPYLVKPFFHFDQGFKNLTFADAKPLLSFLEERSAGASDLVIQRVLRGGDGWVFDCYGLCDRNGEVITMASHRRVRQSPPDFGITCYGEIPGTPRNAGEQALFDGTRKLLAGLNYHGIFGIEWLQDRNTGELYLLDFNARPFYTIGHLRDCGMNLPVLAYRELCGDDLSAIEMTPKLKHKYWVDFWRDLSTFNALRRAGRMTWTEWMASLLKCRSFGVWSAGDPLPAIAQALRKISGIVKRRVTAQN